MFSEQLRSSAEVDLSFQNKKDLKTCDVIFIEDCDLVQLERLFREKNVG